MAAGTLRVLDLHAVQKLRTSAGGKLGLFGVTPVVRAAAYNQTAYSTAARATTAAVAATGASNSTPYGYTTAAQADAIVSSINNLKQLVNALIDDAQAYGLAQ